MMVEEDQDQDLVHVVQTKTYLEVEATTDQKSVITLLQDEAAQTHNPYLILIPYYVAFYTLLGFFIHAFSFEIWS